MTVAQALAAASQHLEAGRLSEAEAICRQILVVNPRHAEALHSLGMIAHQVGRDELALEFILQAIAAEPAAPVFHSNLGEVYRKLGRPKAAVVAYRRALHFEPNYAEIHNNLGNGLRELGQLEESIAACRRAIELRPNLPQAHNNLGNALRDQGRLEEAETAYRRALEFHPNYPEAYSNLGVVLRDQGKTEEAKLMCHRAIQLQPGYAEAHNNLGNAFRDQGQFDAAAASYRRALDLQSNYADALNNLGSVLWEQQQFAEGMAAFRRALELKPTFAEAHSNLLFNHHFVPDFDPEELFREHCRWDQIQARPLAKFINSCQNEPNVERRLRIGYVSPDFREHAAAFFFEGLLAAHREKDVEVFCYSNVLKEDAVTARLRENAAHWRTITALADEQVARLISDDGIDILVDLAGHTARHRLGVFARKPAPIQATYLGYCDTTGLSTMDYRLTDAYADPPGKTEHLHSEKLIRLPDIFATFHPPVEAPPVAPPPCLDRGHVTFGSFHTPAKLNDSLLECWARILREVPDSRLLVVVNGVRENSQPERLRYFFGSRGIAVERLQFEERRSLADFLQMHRQVDVLLDSFPFTGHTTACHALWMGVPVVTLAGSVHCTRMVGSVLNVLGLPELITQTPEEYVSVARRLAQGPVRLAHLRSTLRARMKASPLLDAPGFARNIEDAYRRMWREWCVRQPTASEGLRKG